MILTHGANSLTRAYYHTLFENFDFSTRIDYPIIGNATQYDTSSNSSFEADTLIYDGATYNALKMVNTTSTLSTNSVPIKINSYIEFICRIDMYSSSAPTFIWVANFGFYVDLNKGNTLGILCDASISSFILKNGATMLQTSYGVTWFSTPLNNNKVFLFRVDYLRDKTILSVDGVEYVQFNVENHSDNIMNFDPRMNNNLIVTDLKMFIV